MGGFTYNGFGVGDSFYPKQDLGTFYCYGCKSIQEFALMEVRRKIKLLYIPTVSINTKFAVGCRKCKNGYYINDQQRDDLLFHRTAIEVRADGIAFKQIAAPGAAAVTLPTPEVRSVLGETGGVSCPNCGQAQGSGKRFCVYCGTQLPTQTDAAPVQKFCVHCGAQLVEGQIFCSECGMKAR